MQEKAGSDEPLGVLHEILSRLVKESSRKKLRLLEIGENAELVIKLRLDFGDRVEITSIPLEAPMHELGKFDFIVSAMTLTKSRVKKSFKIGLMGKGLARGKTGEERVDERIEEIHRNVLEALKPGGRAIHVSHPKDPPIQPKRVDFHTVMSYGHTALILEKRTIRRA
jgi:hypothetical protein